MNSESLLANFVAEIEEVQRTLIAATNDLTSPLGDLVRAQIKRSKPPICAAVVLAVATPKSTNSQALQEEDNLRHKRILLAAALEMLHVALNVHRLLVNAALREQQSRGEIALDPAFIGSTILAGDYCFSRAAQMAAQTDHARVVAIFALALQTVSEGLLREQFRRSNEQSGSQIGEPGRASHPLGDNNQWRPNSEYTSEYNSTDYDETRQLLHSGAHAAALLIGLPESEQQQAIALSHELASRWAHKQQATNTDEVQTNGSWGEALPGQWQALDAWFNQQPVKS